MDIEDGTTRHVGVLDGLRGLAALWVLVGHALSWSGYTIPVLNAPIIGVDIFIVISGFLVTKNYLERSRSEPIHHPSTWARFWIRRIFRIVPSYYTVVLILLMISPMLISARLHQAVGHNARLVPHGYTDHTAFNILSHISFLSGLIPDNYDSMPTPDWSLSLEMQFYALFPFLILAVSRFGWLRSALVVSAICLILQIAFYDYFRRFTLTSPLPLKLNVFLGGMMLAGAVRNKGAFALHAVMAFMLTLLPSWGWSNVKLEIIRAAAMIFVVPLLLMPRLPLSAARLMYLISAPLSGRLAGMTANASFCLYLVHPAVMDLVVGNLVCDLDLSPPMRFLVTLAIVAPIVCIIAFLMHRFVELPGARLGRQILAIGPSRNRDSRGVRGESAKT